MVSGADGTVYIDELVQAMMDLLFPELLEEKGQLLMLLLGVELMTEGEEAGATGRQGWNDNNNDNPNKGQAEHAGFWTTID